MSEKEKLRFYEIAHGSFQESATILDRDEIFDEEMIQADRHHISS